MNIETLITDVIYLSIDVLSAPRQAKVELQKAQEKTEYLQSRITGTGIDYTKEKIQSTPDPDPIANVVEDVIKEENNLQHRIMMYNLSLLVLEADCTAAGLDPEQIKAILMYYDDIDRSYEKVARIMNLSKEKIRYYVKGKGNGKYTIQYKLASVYLDIIRNLDKEE